MPKQWILVNNRHKLQQARLGATQTWLITHDREQVQVGDAVVLWHKNTPAGIYALGEIIQKAPPDAAQTISIRYTHVLPQLLLQELLKNHPVLRNMAVMHSLPVTLNCSNFPLKIEEWQALQRVIEQSFTMPTTSYSNWQNYVAPSFAEIVQHIQAQGLHYSETLLRRYHLSLHSRQFVILSGISGMGKTALAEHYARAVQAEYVLLPVAPNWMSNEDLLGYYNPLTHSYQDTECSLFLRRAAQECANNPTAPCPYHLILDEMNLARVEYYFARFLSLLEVQRRGQKVQIDFTSDDSIVLPHNLYVIGTVNRDETTQGLADKVYDRAQYLELLLEREQIVAHLGEQPYSALLLELWDVLQPVAPFAFRVIDDMQAYIQAAKTLNIAWQTAIDEQVLQKLLPKLSGTDERLEPALLGLQDCAKRYGLPLTERKAQALYAAFLQQGMLS